MKRRVILIAALMLAPAGASAQGFRPIFDHIHLAAPDVPAALAWYRQYFGGEPMTEAPDRLMYGDTRLIFQRRDSAQPSQGSSVDHIGFSVADIDRLVKRMESDGVKIAQPVRDVAGLFKLAFIEDPWGTRIEVVQDSAKLGLHHVHLRAPDPAAALAWYSTNFGGPSGKLKDRIDGLNLSGVWLLVAKGDAVPSQGHSIHHIGLRAIDLDASGRDAEDTECKDHHRAAAVEARRRLDGAHRVCRRSRRRADRDGAEVSRT
jgi:catechol 2,3-dioxygenase-like lactoylglutathione lyase family enzyme